MKEIFTDPLSDDISEIKKDMKNSMFMTCIGRKKSSVIAIDLGGGEEED